MTSLWIENRTTVAHESGSAWIHLNCYSTLCKKFKKERVLWITISKIGVHNGVQKGAQIEMQRERNIICSKRAQKITEIGFWIVHEGVLKGAQRERKEMTEIEFWISERKGVHEGVLKGAQRERKIISSKGAQRNNSNWMSNSGAERSAQGSAKRVKTPFFCKKERKRERQ